MLIGDAEQPNPLSVSADRIGHAAMRAAGLLAMLADHRYRIDRTGRTGLVVEVYPAAALKHWGLTHRKYKGTGSAAERTKLLARLLGSCKWLSMSKADKTRCKESDDAFDAVVCALIARAAALGKVTEAEREQLRPRGDRGLDRRTDLSAAPTCPGDRCSLRLI